MSYYPNNYYADNQKINSPPPDYGWSDYSAMPSNAHPGLVEAGTVSDGTSKNLLFDEKAIRAAFIRKVFATVTLMLSIVAVMTALPKLHDGTGLFIRQNSGLFYWSSFITFMIVYTVLICCKKARRTYPLNVILTGIFTVAAGMISMVIATHYAWESIVMSLIITIISCAGVAIYAAATKRDLTDCIAVMTIISLVFCAFGFVAVFAIGIYNIPIARIGFSLAGAFLMMAWLAIDTQLLMGGKRMEVSPEDHIFIAVQLFIDILYVFWYILQAFGTDNQ